MKDAEPRFCNQVGKRSRVSQFLQTITTGCNTCCELFVPSSSKIADAALPGNATPKTETSQKHMGAWSALSRYDCSRDSRSRACNLKCWQSAACFNAHATMLPCCIEIQDFGTKEATWTVCTRCLNARRRARSRTKAISNGEVGILGDQKFRGLRLDAVLH